ncbi:MAG: hypothetical protein ACK4IX_00965 [Candidatus Sericytochromatia bacterium]
MKKFLKLKISSIVCLLPILLSLSVQAEEKISIEKFQYYTEIKGDVSKNKISYIYLNDDILNKSENNLKDIRIFNNSNTEIPFTLIDEQIPEDSRTTKNFEIVDYSSEKSKDIIFTEIKDQNIPNLDKINFETSNTNFNKKVKVYGSKNSKKWKLLAESNIYDFSSKINLRKTKLELKTPFKYKFYKFEIDNLSKNELSSMLKINYKGLELNMNDSETDTFKIDSITGETFSKNKGFTNYDIKEFKPDIQNKDKKSIIELKNKLGINEIDFDISDPYYYREVSVFSGDKSDNLIAKEYIYDLGDNESDEKKEIKLNNLYSSNLRLEIINYDNPSLVINKIKTKRVKKNLFFTTKQDENYKLFISNKEIEAPIYDINNYINQYNWYKTSFNKLNTSEILENKNFKKELSKEDKEKSQKNILMGLVFLVLGILGFWIYKMMMGMKK